MHRHTGPAPGIMIWGGIGNNPRNPLLSTYGWRKTSSVRLSFRETGQRVGRNQVTGDRIIAGCERKGLTDLADRTHLIAPLPRMTGGL
ncbi:hypothetical protein TNCV_340281 [Trichonephila clavipes]|nr:hypothetical protein TNCV_340281 [Trichonephila clavipes]